MWECSHCKRPIHDHEEGYLIADDDLTNWRIVHRFSCDTDRGPWHPLAQFIGKRGPKNFKSMERGGAFSDLSTAAIEELRRLVVRESYAPRGTIRATFRRWLRDQAMFDTPIGDLARDMNKDPYQVLPNPSLQELYGYLRAQGASSQALATLVEAYREWQSYGCTYRESRTDRPKKKARLLKPVQERDGWLALRFKILKRDNYRCQLCGRDAQDGVKLEVDHKHPRSKGGTDDPTNLWTLCFDCNRGKRDNLL